MNTTKARLLACPACARHIRMSERACLFCGLVLPASFGEAPVLPQPARMSRGGLVGYRARAIAASTVALATAGCGSTIAGSSSDAGSNISRGDSSQTSQADSSETSQGDSSQGDTGGGGIVMGSTTVYGGPWPYPIDDGSAEATAPPEAGALDGSPPDAVAVDSGASDASDHDVGALPAYGLSP
jgi:hypothetical protein